MVVDRAARVANANDIAGADVLDAGAFGKWQLFVPVALGKRLDQLRQAGTTAWTPCRP